MKFAIVALIVLLSGCSNQVQEIKPTSPVDVNPVKVEWKVIADVRTIDDKQYLVIPFTGSPYIAITYSDSLRLRSWMNDVKRYKDQSNILMCYYGHVEKCREEK
ncbi:hypothetical protein POP12_232 [Pectobacterium phage POP12]|nr:hypothetical protein POP12_232 [Pectobacterium phage POP12]